MSRQLSGLLVLLCVLAGCGRERPNLVVISLDTTRADHLGAYGDAGARTPNVDALAREGFLFRRHLTPVPITLPAHATLLTGRYPPTHGVRDNGTFIVPAGELTLAEVLRAEGYDTSAFIGAFPLDARFGLDQGFATYDDELHAGEVDRRRQREDIFFDERPARAVVDAALAYHRQRTRRPFFTFLHFYDPHQPQLPPAPYDVEFRDRPYDGEIAYVDAQLGRFFDELRQRGEWDDTVIVLTADHGEGLGEHGELTHAILLHQATLHIPLILRGPGVPRGESAEWTLANQVFATVLDLLEVPVPRPEVPPAPSLVPLLASGGVAPPGTPPFTAYFETIAPRTAQGWSQLTAWMKEDWRLVHGPRPELYQLEHDPQEREDRHAREPAVVQTLNTELREFLDRYETRSAGDSMTVADAETVQRLAALGYLQADPAALTRLHDMLAVEGLPNPRDLVVDVSVFSEAKAAMARGNLPLAESLWQEVLRRSPENVNAYRSLAVIYGQTGDWPRCFEQLDRALAVRPDGADLLRLKGELLVEVGRFQEGLDLLQELPADSVQATTWLGIAHQGLGRFEEAKQWYRKGLEIDPKSRWLRLYLANRLAAEGSFAEAEGVYRALIADAPYFPLAFYNYGKMLLDRGDFAQARGLLQRAVTLAPQHEPSRVALRRAEAELGS